MSPEIESNEGQRETTIPCEGINASLEEKVLQGAASFPQIIELYDGEEHEIMSPELVERRARTVRNLDKYIASNRTSGRARILRDKQMAVFVDTRNFINDGNTEGFVEAPTGFGKTVLFSEFIKATNEKTVIAVPSRLLVEQTYARLRQFNPNIDIGRFYSDVKEKGRQITVTTYQSLALSNGGVNPEDVDLLVLDEVHQSLTDIRIEAANRFTRSIKLGFTATPEYTEDKRVQNLLNNEIHTITLKEAVETGLLSSFSVYLAETDVDLSNIKVTQGGEYDPRELEEAVNIYSRNKSAVELYKQLIAQNPDLAKAVSYCVSINHAREVAALFNAEGIPAGAVWSDQDPHERKEVMDAYRRGELKILTNVNILTEGFDDPESALCLNLRPTLSRVVAKQRGGRVLRLDPANPKKHAIIVDYLDRNDDKRNAQVTFAQVAEGAQIQNQTTIDTRTGLVGPNGKNGGGLGIDAAKPFNIEGLNVITNAEEVLRIIREIEIGKYEVAPEGWMNRYNLAVSTGRDSSTIERRIDQLLVDHSEWSQIFLDSRSKPVIYYSKELVDRVREDLGILQNSPKGWMVIGSDKNSTGTICELLGRGSEWVRNRLKQLINDIESEREENKVDSEEQEEPLCGIFLGLSRQPTVYYSPLLTVKLLEKHGYPNKAPSGWMTIGAPHIKKSISAIVGKSREWVEKHAENVALELEKNQFDDAQSDQLKHHGTFKGKTYDKVNFYSPEVVGKLIKIAEEEDS